jgi:citrate lyase beta subunit
MSESREKIDAIYELREASAAKARLEDAVADASTPDARAALLDATLDVEEKTQRAIEVCHECGHAHASDREHGSTGGDNLIRVDFRPDEKKRAGEADGDAG